MSQPASAESPRTAREKRTIRAMIEIYCRGRHEAAEALCPECQGLLVYAFRRLSCCPFGPQKTTCAQCPIHCYKPEMRQRVKEVMRYAGPRMLYRHPILALLHQLEGLGKKPEGSCGSERLSRSTKPSATAAGCASPRVPKARSR